MATLQYTIIGNHSAQVARSVIQTRQVVVTVGDSPSTGKLTVTETGTIDVPLGQVATPRYMYAVNLDPDNYISIIDDATEIARLLPGDATFIALPAGVDLKAQANTDDCEMLFAVYGAA
jgi:hypothetical protein